MSAANGNGQKLDWFRYDANNQLIFAHDSSGVENGVEQKPIDLTVDYDRSTERSRSARAIRRRTPAPATGT